MAKKFAFSLFAIILIHITTGTAQELTLQLSNETLPTNRGFVSSIYDGQDSIYIFGGSGYSFSKFSDILKYSISTDSITLVAELPIPISSGTTALLENGHILYIAGDNDGVWGSDIIYDFDPSTGLVQIGGSFGTRNYFSSLIQPYPSLVYVIGGYYDSRVITQIDLSRNITKVIYEDMPISRPTLTSFWDARGVGSAYIIGLESLGGRTLVVRYTPETEEIIQLQNPFPNFYGHFRAVWGSNLRRAFIVGGYSYEHPTNHILQYDPMTGETKSILVHNFPVGNDRPSVFLTGSSVVYVKKLNRIYLIGGLTQDNEQTGQVNYLNIIGFIDLSPLV